MIHWLLESKSKNNLKPKEWISLKALCKRSNRYAVFKFKDWNTIHAEIIRMRFKIKHFQVPYPGIEPVTFSTWGGISSDYTWSSLCFLLTFVLILQFFVDSGFIPTVWNLIHDTFITNRLTHCCRIFVICKNINFSIFVCFYIFPYTYVVYHKIIISTYYIQYSHIYMMGWMLDLRLIYPRRWSRLLAKYADPNIFISPTLNLH